jgi:hypothetical protein
MKVGLHVVNFSWPDFPASIAPTLAATARAAEEAGVAGLTLMDHWFQMEAFAPPTEPMLEGYTPSATSPPAPRPSASACRPALHAAAECVQGRLDVASAQFAMRSRPDVLEGIDGSRYGVVDIGSGGQRAVIEAVLAISWTPPLNPLRPHRVDRTGVLHTTRAAYPFIAPLPAPTQRNTARSPSRNRPARRSSSSSTSVLAAERLP